MDRRTNPFHELYVTETISNDDFVNLFSPHLVASALPIFLPGNSVVKGVKGSGKSMLLALLKPEIRVAYKQANERFPLSLEQRQFIGAGINLLRSGTADFGQRSFPTDGEQESRVLPLYFADFVNYWIVGDLLRSIQVLREKVGGQLAAELEISEKPDAYDAFAEACGSLDCWFDYLKDTRTLSDLTTRIATRIQSYRAYLNFNSAELPAEISKTKTTIGDPISKVAELLWKSEVLPRAVEIFVRVDQYEEMYSLEGAYKSKGYGALFRQVINKMVGRRDPNVSYRIGTRGYAWADHLEIYGTSAALEEGRDYKLVDLDEMLRRQENTKKWMFPDFAEDVFRRRLLFAGFEKLPDRVIEHAFGTGLKPEKKALVYTGPKGRSRAVKTETAWPPKWQKEILTLAETDPFSAKLAEAWVRQKFSGSKFPDQPSRPYPWDLDRSWRKERIEQALLQIAGACAQRPIYAGRRDVEELSGGNISVFINLCQQIWSAWLRTNYRDHTHLTEIPEIDTTTQSVGILEASTKYFRTIPQQLGDSSSRQRFINVLGSALARFYYSDRALSNPGHNGISLSVADFEKATDVAAFLKSLSDYGELFSRTHTSKERDRAQRIKFYLNPILSPYFRISHKHQKEPIYVRPIHVTKWIDEAEGGNKTSVSTPSDNPVELPLFSGFLEPE